MPVSAWWDSLTVVVPTSPVPSNPSTEVLEAVFGSFGIVPRLVDAPKLVQLDGAQEELSEKRRKAYDLFEARVRKLASPGGSFLNTRVYRSNTFLFAAHNLGTAINHVVTPYIFVLQHDFILVRPFDAERLLATMQRNAAIKHVRLNARPNVAKGFDGYIANYTGDTDVPLTRTCGWSDGPHIASVQYYRKFCMPLNARDYNEGRRKFMEESIHYRMQRNGAPGGCWELKRNATIPGAELHWPKDFDKYGTYLYGVASSNDGNYMSHRSLRGSQPQWGIGRGPNHNEPTIADGVVKQRRANRQNGRGYNQGAVVSPADAPAGRREARGIGGRGAPRHKARIGVHWTTGGDQSVQGPSEQHIFTEARAELHQLRGRRRRRR